jgi:hypothetical protein
MARTTETPNDPAPPPELLAAVAADAGADADLAIGLLRRMGLGPQRGQTAAWPGRFLLNLGAALRLWVWELSGVTVHRDAGLPAARDAFRQVWLRAAGPTADDPHPFLYRAVIRLATDRLAWTGRRDLAASVVLGDPDEEALVDALAHLLWAHRHPDRTIPPRIYP